MSLSVRVNVNSQILEIEDYKIPLSNQQAKVISSVGLYTDIRAKSKDKEPKEYMGIRIKYNPFNSNEPYEVYLSCMMVARDVKEVIKKLIQKDSSLEGLVCRVYDVDPSRKEEPHITIGVPKDSKIIIQTI